ncbi:MAG: HAD family hydrolase [Muribaculaceae bacterium]|nr:HAD family hydrolase [Muribaculaceae bacterium]
MKLRADVVIESNDKDAVARFIAEDFARQSQLNSDPAGDSARATER